MAETREQKLQRIANQYAATISRMQNKGILEPTKGGPPIFTNEYLKAHARNIAKNQKRISTSTDPLEYLKLEHWNSNNFNKKKSLFSGLFSQKPKPHNAAAAAAEKAEKAEKARAAAARRAAEIEASVAGFQTIIKQAATREAAAKEAAKAVSNPGSKKGGRRLTRSKRRAASTRRKSRQ
jgi:hypothetical protein